MVNHLTMDDEGEKIISFFDSDGPQGKVCPVCGSDKILKGAPVWEGPISGEREIIGWQATCQGCGKTGTIWND